MPAFFSVAVSRQRAPAVTSGRCSRRRSRVGRAARRACPLLSALRGSGLAGVPSGGFIPKRADEVGPCEAPLRDAQSAACSNCSSAALQLNPLQHGLASQHQRGSGSRRSSPASLHARRKSAVTRREATAPGPQGRTQVLGSGQAKDGQCRQVPAGTAPTVTGQLPPRGVSPRPRTLIRPLRALSSPHGILGVVVRGRKACASRRPRRTAVPRTLCGGRAPRTAAVKPIPWAELKAGWANSGQAGAALGPMGARR